MDYSEHRERYTGSVVSALLHPVVAADIAVVEASVEPVVDTVVVAVGTEVVEVSVEPVVDTVESEAPAEPVAGTVVVAAVGTGVVEVSVEPVADTVVVEAPVEPVVDIPEQLPVEAVQHSDVESVELQIVDSLFVVSQHTAAVEPVVPLPVEVAQ